MKAPIPADEEERARLVDEYRILDTPQEAGFDELARLASIICVTPVALVTIVHGERQWIKSNIGFRDITGQPVHQTSRDDSFCAHGIGHPGEMLVVADALQDSRFADNALVTGHPRVRFYAGAPLVAEGGHVLGSLCVLDQQPRELTDIQLEGLRILARQAQAQLDLRRALRERDERQAELTRVSEVRRNFVSVVSHEFRTPLTVIQGFSQMLATEPFTEAEVREYATDICNEATRLGRLIADMLDLDRMESGQMRVQRTRMNLNDMVRTEAVRCVGASALHRLALQLDDSLPDIEADPDRMRQVVINLLSNAVKYSPDGGTVTARTEQAGGMVHLEVRDEGVGIAADALERIFDRYARSGTTRDSAIQGTGLGLSIVRQIVQLHGGRVWAESGGRAGTGSALHVEVPVDAAGPGGAE